MTNTIEYFDKNGYVVLSGALSKDKCEELTQYMFTLYEQGKLVKDEQCPLSDAIYGDPIFDDLLQKFAAPIGSQVGKQLIPTYTYARIYRPGEVLKKHTDRPACEISATMTLGFDAPPIWPIFVDENKCIPVTLDAGELVVYKGCEIVHWRTAFKGKWHVQVFFHYVDANGPFKNHARDGRHAYGVQKNVNVEQRNVVQERQQTVHAGLNVRRPVFNSIIIPTKDSSFPGYIGFDNNYFPELKFTVEECERIKSLASSYYPTNASIGGNNENSKVDKSIRAADIYNIENTHENSWIYDKIATAVSVANAIHFDYDIAGITHGIQLIHYHNHEEKEPGHYDWHVDAGVGDVSVRKISYVAQISNPNEYENCELIINNHGNVIAANKEQGSVHMFPSYMVHQVTPITKGERYSLVIWIHGSRRFR